MQKQLQKLGIFLNIKEPEPKTNEKKVKYLFRNGNEPSEKPKQRKIKSADESKPHHSKKYDPAKCDRKKSTTSLKPKRKKSVKALHLNIEKEFFIPPEDIRKHHRKSNEIEGDNKRKHDHHKSKEHDKEKLKKNEQRALTKYDLLKLLKSTKDLPPIPADTATFLKNFLVLEKLNDLAESTKNKLQHNSKNPVCESNKKTEIIHFASLKKQRQSSVGVVYSHDVKSEVKPKSSKHSLQLYKRKHKGEEKIVFEELKIGESTNKKERQKAINKAKRSNFAVQTFEIIEIPPSASTNMLEMKKRLRAYKKYYKYNKDIDTGSTVSSAFHTFSDSHKLYDDKSEKSIRDLLRKRSSRQRKSSLKLMTNVSSIEITPEPKTAEKEVNTVSSSKFKMRKSGPQKSKIPVLTQNSRLVELASESNTTPRSHRKSSQLFNTRESQNRSPEEKHKKCLVSKESKKKVIKASSSLKSSLSGRSSNISNKSKKLKIRGSCESRVSRSATVSKLNKKDVQSKKSVQICSTALTPVLKSSKSSSKKTAKFSNKPPEIRSPPELRKKGFSTRSSISNSTFGDKSIDSNKNAPSFLMTKIYKDNEKLDRWQKRKLYADTVRKKVISRRPKPSIPPQILEVRYVTVTQENSPNETISTSDVKSEAKKSLKKCESKKELQEDLPQPNLELIECKKFDEMFASPLDDALKEILSENYDFLNKDFTVSVDDLTKLTISDGDLSLDNLGSETKLKEWCNIELTNLNDVFCATINDPCENLILEDQLIDSLSAPSSVESGYETIKTTSFFERPDIKLLLNPPDFGEFSLQMEPEPCNSNPPLEIHSIESKCLQAKIDCSQKSMQTQEEISETITFSEQETQTKEEESKTIINISEYSGVGDGPTKDERKQRKKFLIGLLSCFKSHSSDK